MSEEIDYSKYLNKAPTPLQSRFAQWITDQTGFDPAGAKTKQAAFAEGVRLAVALRIPFQASPENRQATEDERAAREEARAAKRAELQEAAEERAQAREAKAEERAAARAAKAEKAEKAATPAATPATRPAGRRPAKAATSTSVF